MLTFINLLFPGIIFVGDYSDIMSFFQTGYTKELEFELSACQIQSKPSQTK